MTIFKLAVLATALCMATIPATAENTNSSGDVSSTIILTVSGEVGNPTRTGSDEAIDKFFDYNNLSFEKAAQFDFFGLATLNQQTITTDFPMGGDTVTFEGPLLSDVLNAAGAAGDTVTLTALDGYAIEVPFQELVDKGAVLALARDGIPFGIGDFGPTQLVFPRSDREDLADMNDDWWIWSIYYISIE